MPFVTAALTACISLNTPVLRTGAPAPARADVLAIQSLVAEVLDPALTPRAGADSALSTVLDVQRLLGGTPDAGQRQRSPEAPVCWAVTSAPLRGDLPDFTPMPLVRSVEVPRSAAEGLQQQVQPFPPPALSRVLERYRMMLTPHAPPRPGECQFPVCV